MAEEKSDKVEKVGYVGYVLTHYVCNDCVYGEAGHYNAICAHCPYCTYSKGEPKFMTREFAERLGIVKPKE